jgi:hypothetical protein
MRPGPGFRQAINRPTRIPDPETNPWWWNPGRMGVEFAPADFRRKLKELGEELECTKDPIRGYWMLWAKAPRLQHKICQGWRLLFVNRGPNGEHIRLDERVFARLYAASVLSTGSAKGHFERIKREMERDEERKERQHQQDTIDLAMPSWEHSQIKVSMRGKSNGSKFSTYHA